MLAFTRKIIKFEYDEPTQVLTVHYHSGEAQEFASVPEKVYRAMQKSRDVDFFFQDRIFGQYPYPDATKAFSYIRRKQTLGS